LALGAFQHATSVEALARIIDGAIGPGSLVPLQPRGSQRPFICVHAHMGHVLNLRELARQFAPERPFYGLQAKGLDGAELPETDLEAMAAAYVASVREMQPHGPYLLGGYCFGGWVAIEMARQLRSSGESVEALLLIATNLLPGMLPTLRGEGMVHQYASWWARARRKTLRSALSSIRYRLIHSAQGLRTSLLSHASRWGLTRRWPLMHALREPASAIAVMLHGYRPDPYPGGAVVLAPANMPLDEATQQAWQDFVRGPIEFVSLAGDSKDLLRQPYVRDVAACIMARIH
jgi:thioesterase domain-containing protein